MHTTNDVRDLLPGFLQGISGRHAATAYLEILKHLVNEHDQAAASDRSLFRSVFVRYLAEIGSQGRETLLDCLTVEGVCLLNKAGKWKSPKQLAFPCDGLREEDTINDEQAGVLSLLRPEQRTLIARPEGYHSQQTADFDHLAVETRRILEEYFGRWTGLVRREMIGAFIATLGNSQPVVAAAGDFLEVRSLDSVREEIDASGRGGPEGRFLQQVTNYTIACVVHESSRVSVLSVLGNRFSTELGNAPRTIFLGDGVEIQPIAMGQFYRHTLHLRRPDVDILSPDHQTVTLDVHWTVEETKVSDLLTEYILKSLDFARGSDRGTQLVVQLVMHTFHKIAASSWAALDRALQRRLDALDGKASKLSELLGDADDGENSDGPPMDFVLPVNAFFENERKLLETLLARLRALAVDSKWKRCAHLLADLDKAEPGVKVLVFTQYRATQDILRERLGSLFPGAAVEVIHGEVEMRERQQTRLRFEGQSRFLVSTEAGGEGVNLQRACHVMLNYDWPWNPMRLQQRIGRLDRYGQKRVVQVFNLRVPDSWDQHIATRIIERLDVTQRTMAIAGPGIIEDYREMILGQVAEQVDAVRLFAESQAGRQVSDADMDKWVHGAVQSAERWRSLFGPELGVSDDSTRLKPTLTSVHLKSAYKLACEHQGIQFRETRNSLNQFVHEVFNFDLPSAFRDPVFRPSRTMHVVFDREVYAAVRGQDLGTVRGQPIRPLLTGFGEPFTDWLFQTALYANSDESAFAIHAGKSWTHGPGWLFVFALRCLGKRRRLSAPDSLFVCFLDSSAQVIQMTAAEGMTLVEQAQAAPAGEPLPTEEAQTAARRLAQQALKLAAANRDAVARQAAGLSLLMTVSVSAG